MLKIYMLKTLLKFALAIGLLYWLARSGKLDFSLIAKSYNSGFSWLFVIGILIIQGMTTTYRLKKILETKSSKPFKFFEIIRYNWIGMFFSSILPGAVTGDFIKLYYIKKHDKSFTKVFLVTAIMLDRILGLLGLLFVSGLISLIYYSDLAKISDKLTHVILVNYFLFLGGSGLMFILFAPKKMQKLIIHFIYKIPKIGHTLVSKIEPILNLNQNRPTFFFCFLLSILSQTLSIFAFWYLTKPFYEVHIPLAHAFSFIPIGLIAVAIPISPAGLGVGHAMFQNLFSFVGIHNGASLFNLFFICGLGVNLLGLIPYLMAPKISDHQIKDELDH